MRALRLWNLRKEHLASVRLFLSAVGFCFHNCQLKKKERRWEILKISHMRRVRQILPKISAPLHLWKLFRLILLLLLLFKMFIELLHYYMLWPNHSGRTTVLYDKDSHLTSFIHNIKSSFLSVLCWPLLQLTMLLVTFHTLKFLYSVASSLACKTQKPVWMCRQITHRVFDT
jgi:hypothetical protein